VLAAAGALLMNAQSTRSAGEATCKFIEWGHSYITVERASETWTYQLTALGPKWRNRPYGYQAPGQLACENCSSTGKAWNGLYHLDVARSEQPTEAEDRAQRRKEAFG
jgi:hypothetical protein